MRLLKGSERRQLKALAHNRKPVVYIGKNGLTDALIAAVESALDSHELIKVKFNCLKEERHGIAAAIEARTRSVLVGVIGNIATLYRQHPDEEKRKIILKKG